MLRGTTTNCRKRMSAVVNSSASPTRKRSCPASPDRLANGTMSTDGLSPVATARHRPNQPLARAAVADRLTDRGDPAAQRGLRHQAAAPHRAQHIVAGHDAVPVLQKIKQNVEHLALKRGALAGSREFTPLGIKSVGPEPEDHLSLPRQGAEKKSGQSQQKSRLSQGHRRSPGLVL